MIVLHIGDCPDCVPLSALKLKDEDILNRLLDKGYEYDGVDTEGFMVFHRKREA